MIYCWPKEYTLCFCGKTLYSAGRCIQLPDRAVFRLGEEGDKSALLYLSSLWVGDAGVAEVTVLPLGIEAVAL